MWRKCGRPSLWERMFGKRELRWGYGSWWEWDNSTYRPGVEFERLIEDTIKIRARAFTQGGV